MTDTNRETKVSRVKDGDTLRTRDGDDLRVGYIDTPESVHRDSSRNTPEGVEASKLTKALLPKGSTINKEVHGTGIFNRQISSISKNIKGKDIDLGLVLLDQDMSEYYTRYGEHLDPTRHEQYSAYFSKDIPYQFGDVGSAVEPLTAQEVTAIQTKQKLFKETLQNFKDGKATQEELDEATYELYNDPDKIVRYRTQISSWNKPTEDLDKESLAYNMRKTFERNPELREQYNKAVRNRNLMAKPVPEAEPSFWESAAVPFKLMGSVAAMTDLDNLWRVRLHGDDDFKVPKDELLKGVPKQHHATILNEATRTNDEAALMLRDQLIEDVELNKSWDNMPLYAQFGYGALAMLGDPLSYAPLGVAAKAGKGIMDANKAWQMSRVIKGKSPITGSNTMATMTSWAAISGMEGAAYNTAQLTGDHTFTARDYVLNTVFDTALGGVLGGVVAGAKKAYVYKLDSNEKRESDAKAVEAEFKRKAESEKKTKEDLVKHAEQEVEQTNNPTKPEYDQTIERNQATRGKLSKIVQSKKPDAPKKVVPLQAISKVSKEGFQTAYNTMKKAYGDSPITKLLNSQLGLNKKSLPDDTKEVVTKLNADLVHIMAAFPDGRVPDEISKAISEVTFKQKSYNRNNALQDVLTGETSNPTETMKQYVDYLRKQEDLFEGYDVQPMTAQEFFEHNKGFLELEQTVADDDIMNLSRSVPKELSLLKDAVELNRMAQESDNAEFKAVIEELNGMIAARMEQKEFGDFKDKVDAKDYFEAYVPLAPQEIQDILKKEGLKAGTPDYKARVRALRKERVPVSKAVREFGKLESRKKVETEEGKSYKDAEREEYYITNDERADWDKLDVENDLDILFDMEAKDSKPKNVETRVDPEFVKDLLPRSFLETRTISAYKNPTKESLEQLRKKINSKIIKPLGLNTLDRYDTFKTERRIAKVKQAILNNPKGTIMQRVVSAGQWQNVEDVIRASATLAEEAKIKQVSEKANTPDVDVKLLSSKIEQATNDLKKVDDKILRAKTKLDEAEVAGKNDIVSNWKDTIKLLEEQREILQDNLKDLENSQSKVPTSRKPTGKKAEPVKSDDKGKQDVLDRLATVKPITEDVLEQVVSGNTNKLIPKLTPDELSQGKKSVNDAYAKVVEDKTKEIDDNITEWITSGKRAAWEVAKRALNVSDAIGRFASSITKDLATRFQNSNIYALEYVGANFTELGRGGGGSIQRPMTASVMRETYMKESLLQIMPQYTRIMDDYAAEHGKGAIGKMMAQQLSGAESKLVDKFNREFFTLIELTRQGKPIPTNSSKAVKELLTEWNKYMDSNFDLAIDSRLGGFTKDRKVKNYIPHIWQPSNVNKALKLHGEDKVIRVLAKGMLDTNNNGIDTHFEAMVRAKEHLDWIKEQGKLIDQGRAGETDQYMPTSETRAKQRLDVDTTAEIDGLSILDLLDTDVISLAVKYSNRLAGMAGMSKASNGAINSELAIKTLKEQIIEEGKSKNIPTKDYEQWYDDMVNMLVGRPTRNGLAQELRMLKDLTALTRMGMLGVAQAIETAAVTTRLVRNLFSSEPMIRHVMKIAKASGSEERVFLDEVQSLSKINDEIEWMQRQSVHLDQEEMSKVSKIRQFSLGMTNWATFGKLKAPASRLLGKTTGFNMIRKYQSRVVQSSFIMDTAKHFKNRTGKMGNARMADVGLTDTSGNNKVLEDVFNNIVEWDATGLPSKLNVDKWPKEARELYMFAMNRDEAQNIQKTLVGELPPWMNRPLVALGMQFREMPLVANNKQLARSMAFADKEAVTGVLLNAAFAGLLRYGRFAGMGYGAYLLTGKEAQEPNYRQTQEHMYMTQGGIFPDLTNLAMSAYTAGHSGIDNGIYGNPDVERLLNQVPVMGLMKDYKDSLPIYDDYRKNAEAAQGLVPLGNTAYGDLIHTYLMEKVNGAN